VENLFLLGKLVLLPLLLLLMMMPVHCVLGALTV
jgi:hypothetical protein